ncbi:MAG TPA: hypothetical protein VI583_02030 [Cyclobacteriaceae bacterium]|nr:hypothetical protein [Cyclobacteriaceae bacterium]
MLIRSRISAGWVSTSGVATLWEVGKQALVAWDSNNKMTHAFIMESIHPKIYARFAGKCGFARGAFSFVTFLWASKEK